jgi:hypothetical protein
VHDEPFLSGVLTILLSSLLNTDLVSKFILFYSHFLCTLLCYSVNLAIKKEIKYAPISMLQKCLEVKEAGEL